MYIPLTRASVGGRGSFGGADAARPGGARYLARKVPQIALIFWVIKLLTTGMGEALSDYLVKQFEPVIVVALAGGAFAVVLLVQLLVRRYVAAVYWLTVVMVAVFGTMIADVIHIEFRIAYVVSAAFFAVALAAIFTLWYLRERTLSIHAIDSRSREVFYWATVITTFALGTAVGDLTATTLHLGYFVSGLLFGALFLAPALGYWLFGLNEVFAFWFAYIMTRPLGASFADWIGKPRAVGGLDFGEGQISLVLAAVIVCLVAYLSITRVDAKGTSLDARG